MRGTTADRLRYLEEKKEFNAKVNKVCLNKDCWDTRCSPFRFYKLLQNIGSEYNDSIHIIGLGGLIHLQEYKLNRDLCLWLIEMVDLNNGCLKLYDYEIPLTSEIVSIIIGLSTEGALIAFAEDDRTITSLCNQFKIINNGFIKFSDLENELPMLHKDSDEFKGCNTTMNLSKHIIYMVHDLTINMIAIRNQEKIDGWLTRIKDFKNSKNIQAYIITPTMDMKSKGKLSFDSHLSSQIKDICKCVDNKEELKSEIKSLKYEIEKLKGLLEYDKNNQQLKEKEKQQEYESLKCEMEKLKELLEYEKNNQQLKEKEKQQEYESLKCEIEKLKELLEYEKNNQKADIEAIRFKEFCVPKIVCTTSHGGNPTSDEHAREESLCKENGSNYSQSNAPTANERGFNIVLWCDNLGNYNTIQDFPNESPKEFPKELTLHHPSIENMSSPTAPMKDKVKRYIARKENIKTLENIEIVSIRSSEGDKKYLLDTASFALTLVNKEHLSYQIPNVKQKVRKNAIKKSRSKVCPQSPSVSLPYKLSDDLNDICNCVWNKHSNSEEKIVDFIDTYAIRSEMMTLEPRKWLDDTDCILRNPAIDFKDLNQ
ncbi:hypothetical protein QQP08_005713 [Theobroma cacao]|nr:hypothetical protein QQP08_005713 [Theobroma cacao]